MSYMLRLLVVPYSQDKNCVRTFLCIILPYRSKTLLISFHHTITQTVNGKIRLYMHHFLDQFVQFFNMSILHYLACLYSILSQCDLWCFTWHFLIRARISGSGVKAEWVCLTFITHFRFYSVFIIHYFVHWVAYQILSVNFSCNHCMKSENRKILFQLKVTSWKSLRNLCSVFKL